MLIQLNDILETQAVLDKTIQNKHNVSYSTIYDELKLALAVELSELANEVRCFKFWSVKEPSPKDVILEEYVDGIHFICSLSIAKNADGEYFLPDKIDKANKNQLTLEFNNLFSSVSKLDDANSIKDWFNNYLILGFKLGFTFEEIKTAYFNKNQINFKRQRDNY